MNPPADPQTPLDTASQLAASGNPTAALRILDSLGEDVPAAHLLRAKILAQKEQYSASLPFWRKALGANSAHEETWAGYEESVVRSRRRPLPGFLRPSGLLLSLTALCVLLAVALAWTSSRWSPPPSPPIACPPDPPLRNEFRDLIARVESIHDEVAALAKAKPEPVPPPAPPASDTVVQRETARLAEFVERDDARVAESGQGLGLAREAFGEGRVRAGARREDFERDERMTSRSSAVTVSGNGSPG